MSRSKRRRGHLHAVPDAGPSALGNGASAGRTRHRRRDAERELFVMEESGWLGEFGDDMPPLAASGIARELAEFARVAGEPPLDDILGQLAALGLPPDLLEDSRAVGEEHHAELAGLLRAATAMLTGDPVAGLLGLWEPLLDRKRTVFEAELLGAEILWSLHGAMGDDDLVDGLTRLVEEAAPTGRPEALVMCRMLAHLGPSEINDLTVRAADALVADGLTDRPWVSELGTAVFRRAYRFTDGPERVLVVEFAYGGRPHAFVVIVDDLVDGLMGLYATADVDELARQMPLSSLGKPVESVEVGVGSAARQIRSALRRPMCPEDEDDEAEMESLVPIVRERLRRLADANRAGSTER